MALMESLDGVVLAGGASRRLGVDKALLQFDDGPLLCIVVKRLAQVCPRVLVAVDRADRYRHLGLAVDFVTDESPGLGPLAGLQAALRAGRMEHTLVVACDLPFLNPALLRHMAQLPRTYDALVPRWLGRWQPLHAVYARSCLAVVDKLLASGGGSMHDLLDRVQVQALDEDELRRLDPQGLSLINLNTPADVKRAQRLWRELRAAGG
jgi:molybdopterin-guanine dinucleotide biosynthesis protein A